MVGRCNKQKGNASIIFILMLAGVVGLFPLSTDTAHALQTRALLDDASEVASIAVAALNDPNQGSNSGSQKNIDLVTSYVNAYVPDLKAVQSVKISRLDCQKTGVSCLAHLKNGYQYNIQAGVKEDSWFPSQNIGGFGESYDVNSKAISQKSSSLPIDIMVVADFSSSMTGSWSGGSSKIDDLKDIVQRVAVKLEQNNVLTSGPKDTMGVVPFSSATGTIPTDSNQVCSMSQNKHSDTIPRRLNTIFVSKDRSYCTHAPKGVFHDIELTSHFATLSATFDSFSPMGFTYLNDGIIRGAQLLIKGNNPRRLLLIISDGQANDDFSSMEAAGMCDRIRSTIDAQTAYDGSNVHTRIAFIGYGYNPQSNPSLVQCVGQENVFQPSNTDDLVGYIMSAINEETGHLR